MITITIGKNKYKLPSTINEFTVGQVADITNEEDVFKKISTISGAPVKELRKVGKSEMKNILYHISESLENKDIAKEIGETIKVDGQEFIIPKNLEDVSSGQWFDCEKMLTDLQGNEAMYYAYAMAIYLNKKGEVYGEGDYDITKRVETMKKMRYVDAANINLFFLMIDNEYAQSMKQFSEEKQK